MEFDESSQFDGATKIPKPSAKPKKGILKRAGSVNTPKRVPFGEPIEALNLSTDAGRLLPWLSQASSASKIPKLSVTWWETSSAYGGDAHGRQRRAKSTTPPKNFATDLPPRPTLNLGDLSADDDVAEAEEESVTSGGGGGNSIAGTWWFGRDTRFVPHCAKRGHNHGADDVIDDSADQYLTPTQRKNREIAELKKRLKSALRSLDDKTALIDQLKMQLGSSANIQDDDSVSTTVMLENRKLQQKLVTICDDYEAKLAQMQEEFRKQANDREENLLLQYNQQKFELSGMIQSENSISRSFDYRNQTDASTLTDLDLTYPNIFALQNQKELEACRTENDLLRHKVSEMEFMVKTYESELSGVAPPIDGSESISCTNGTCVAKIRGLQSQIEAYKNECYVWRTRASELQIVAKQQNAELNIIKQHFNEADQSSASNVPLEPTAPSSLYVDGAASFATRTPSPDNRSCKEHAHVIQRLEFELDESKKSIKTLKRQRDGLIEERDRLREHSDQIDVECDEQASKCRSLSEQLAELKLALSENEEVLRSSELSLHNADQQLNNTKAELEVSQMGCQKLRCENEKLVNEKVKLEEQLINTQSAMAQCGISIGPPASSVRRRSTRGAVQQIVFRAQEVQTDLNYVDQLRMESDLKEVNNMYNALKERSDCQVADLENRLSEISTNMVLKNNLVNTLTNQIQLLQDELASLHAGIERERKSFVEKLHEINLIAQKVPYLESDVATGREEMRLLEKEYNKEKEKFEKALEDAASDALKSQNDTSFHFKQRLIDLERELENCQKRLREAEQIASDCRMRFTLERVELEKRLESNLHELDRLQERVFAERSHMEIQAQPDVCDKGVLCYVRQFSKETEIGTDDLYDERVEQMKLSQGELQMTRRQVEVLQEKLHAAVSFQEQSLELEQQNAALTTRCSDLEKMCDDLEAKRLIERADFNEKYETLVEENNRMARDEEEKYHQLEAEFENVRLEMEQIINQYEVRKAEMTSKLSCLESENKDKRRMKDEVAELQKTLDALEASFEREKAVLLKKERELEVLRIQLASEKRVDGGGSVSSIEDLRQRLKQMAIDGKQLRETDILNDSASASSTTASLLADVPILAFSKVPPGSATVDVASVTKSSDTSDSMVTAEDSSASELAGKSVQTDLEAPPFLNAVEPVASWHAVENQALAQSIRQQTHLLQNLRTELQNEQSKRQDAKNSLYERMQKLTLDKTWSSSRRSSSASLKDALDSFPGDKNAASSTLLDLKAKIIFLLHENEQLSQNMNDLKHTVEDFVEKRRALLLLDEQISNSSSSEYSYKSALDTVETTAKKPDDAVSYISCRELRSIREDLEKMAHRFDLFGIRKSATTGDLKEAETSVRRDEETYLMKWLKSEMNREKCELDVLIKWYEVDKNRLELELIETRLKLECLQSENQSLRRCLERKQCDFRDVSRELTFYKQEDGRRTSGLLVNDLPRLRRSRSEDAFNSTTSQLGLVDRLRRATRDLFGLELQFERMEHDRIDLGRQLEMLRGELAMQQIAEQAAVDESAASGSRVEISKRDFETLKKQLHKAEQSAARLDAESTFWQSQMAQLRQEASLAASYKSDAIEKLRSQISELSGKLMNMKKTKDQLIVDCKTYSARLADQLTIAEQKARVLENEAKKHNVQSVEFYDELLTTARKQRDVIRRQELALQRAADKLRQLSDVETGGAEAVVELLRMIDEQQREIGRLEAERKNFKKQAVDQSVEGVGPTPLASMTLLSSDSDGHFSIDQSETEAGSSRLSALQSQYESEIVMLRTSLLQTASALDVNAQSTDVEDALHTVDQLRGKLNALTSEIEQRELKHGHMYDFMYKRGRVDALKRLKSVADVGGLCSDANGAPNVKFTGLSDETVVSFVADDFSGKTSTISANSDALPPAALSVDVDGRVAMGSVALASSSTCSSEWMYENGSRATSLDPGSMPIRADVHASCSITSSSHQSSTSPSVGVIVSADDPPQPPCPPVHHRLTLCSTAMTSSTAITSSTTVTSSTATSSLTASSHFDKNAGRQRKRSTSSIDAAATPILAPLTENLNAFSNVFESYSTTQRFLSLSGLEAKMALHTKDGSDAAANVDNDGRRLNEGEVRLRFLRDSVFYYLMGRDAGDHLQAIMSILKFSDRQRHDVLTAKHLK